MVPELPIATSNCVLCTFSITPESANITRMWRLSSSICFDSQFSCQWFPTLKTRQPLKAILAQSGVSCPSPRNNMDRRIWWNWSSIHTDLFLLQLLFTTTQP
jgi:hypothetical protein